MALSFLTTLTEAEFKDFLKEAVREVVQEALSGMTGAPPEIMDIKLAADFLRLKINTIYEKTSLKLIPHFKKGNKLYFYRSELQEWLNEGKVKTYREIEGDAATYTLTK